MLRRCAIIERRTSMSRYLIKEVKAGYSDGGMDAIPVVSIRYECNGEEKWIHAIEAEGMPIVSIRDDDVFDTIMSDNYDEEFGRDFESNHENSIAGVTLTSDGYEEVYYAIFVEKSVAEEDAAFIRFVLTLLRCDMEETEELRKDAVGRYADELDIPQNDYEIEYLEELEDEEE